MYGNLARWLAGGVPLVVLLLGACDRDKTEPTPKRTPAAAGLFVLHGKAWPGGKVLVQGQYGTLADTEECRKGAWPVERWTGLEHLSELVVATPDSSGTYRAEVKLGVPDDGGRCQWRLERVAVEVRPPGIENSAVHLGLLPDAVSNKEDKLEMACFETAPAGSGPSSADGTQVDVGERRVNCENGNGEVARLPPFERGVSTFELNIVQGKQRESWLKPRPVDQVPGTPAYKARIQREREQVKKSSSSADNPAQRAEAEGGDSAEPTPLQ